MLPRPPRGITTSRCNSGAQSSVTTSPIALLIPGFGDRYDAPIRPCSVHEVSSTLIGGSESATDCAYAKIRSPIVQIEACPERLTTSSHCPHSQNSRPHRPERLKPTPS